MRTQKYILSSFAFFLILVSAPFLSAQQSGSGALIKGTKNRPIGQPDQVQQGQVQPDQVQQGQVQQGQVQQGQSSQNTQAIQTEVSTALDPALVALGSMGASNLYYSYLTLGAVADGFVNQSYEARVAVSVANEAIYMNNASIQSLSNLAESRRLGQADQEVLLFLIETYQLLNNQARSLITFIGNERDDGSQYQKYRTEVWSRIVNLFGIQ